MTHGRLPTVAATAPVEDLPRLARALDGVAEVVPLAGLDRRARALVLGRAEVLLVKRWHQEVRPGEGPAAGARLVQLVSAGADRLPFGELPPGAAVAGNAGAYAEPIAEHVLAVVLALMRRLPEAHRALARGEWEKTTGASLRGAACAVVGYGGIGRAAAGLLRALGGEIHAVNRSGRTGDPVAWVGTLGDLQAVLPVADVVVLALPGTRHTRGVIGAAELRAMKPAAVLVNVGRAELVDQRALFLHLTRQPAFRAALDVWWDEPGQCGAFRPDYPFLGLANVLGTPHSAALVNGWAGVALDRAAANVTRFLRGQPVTGLVDPDDYC